MESFKTMSPRDTTHWAPEGGRRPIENNEAWQLGRQLAVEAYRLTADFPRHERYELASQIRPAAVSIQSNIAEGKGRRSNADFLRFLYIARGSLEEFDTQMRLADKLGYLDSSDIDSALKVFDRLSRALQDLINAVHRDVEQRPSSG
jgi:four helix bundle protein